MDLDAINRRITAVENKSMVNYSSTSGTAFKISYNGTTLTVQSDGSLKANNVIIADNLAEDNEERLQAVEEFIDNLEIHVYISKHSHEISQVNGSHNSSINPLEFIRLHLI